MKIVRARLKPIGGPTSYETMPNKIKSMISKFPGDNFDFVIKDGQRSETKTYGKDFIDEELKGKRLNIDRSSIFLVFKEDGTIDVELGTNEVLTFDNFKKRI